MKNKFLPFLLISCLVFTSLTFTVQATTDYQDYDALIQEISQSIIINAQDRRYTENELKFLTNPWQYVQTAPQAEIDQLLAGSETRDDSLVTRSNLGLGSDLPDLDIALTAEKTVFGLNETPTANFVLTNKSNQSQTYHFDIIRRSNVMPVSYIESQVITLAAGQKYSGQITANPVSDLYDSGLLSFIIDITRPDYVADASLDVFIKTNPKLDLQFFVLDQNGVNKKVFDVNETVNFDLITNSAKAQIETTITQPDGRQLSFDSSNFEFIPSQVGVYKIEVSAWQAGYTPARQDYQLAAVSPANVDDEVVTHLLSANESMSQSTQLIANDLYEQLKGHILLAVEASGELYYVDIKEPVMYSLGSPEAALAVMREQSIGISNDNLSRIQLGNFDLAGLDSDGDGLADVLESSLGTDLEKVDSDGDGFSDYVEIKTGYDPLGLGTLPIDNDFAKAQSGKLFLQAENHGEVYYISPKNNLRYYLPSPTAIRQAIGDIVTGITNSDLARLMAN